MRCKTLFVYLIIGSILSILIGCCKEKVSCNDGVISISPFSERFYLFWCNNNDQEYTYVFNNSKQIDSLKPTCFFTAPVAFPNDESNMRYIILGRLATHYSDTFETILFKDTCQRTVTYEVNMVQRDSLLLQRSGIASMYCAVENIPADYKVEVKYKYVPLP